MSNIACRVCGKEATVDRFAGYKTCTYCGSHSSLMVQDPATIYTATYWSNQEHRSTMFEQWDNLTLPTKDGAMTRVQMWIKALAPITPGKSFEIGCAPGVFLRTLLINGWDPYGMEGCKALAEEVATTARFPIDRLFWGLFPEIDRDPGNDYRLVCAMDVLEHSPNPQAFVDKMHSMLEPGGYALIQTPVDRETGSAPPFGDNTDRMFLPLEHVVIVSDLGLSSLFHPLKWSYQGDWTWAPGHDIYLFRKLPHE